MDDGLQLRRIVGGILAGFGLAAAATAVVLLFVSSPDSTPVDPLRGAAYQDTALHLLVYAAFPTTVLGLSVVPKRRWADTYRHVMDDGSARLCMNSAVVSGIVLWTAGPLVVDALVRAGVVIGVTR